MERKSIAQPIAISSQLSYKLANMSFICAFLVVVIHCYVDSEHGSVFWWLTEFFGGGRFLSGGLVRIAVPYFFVAAGFFLAGHMGQKGWWHTECAKRVRSIVVPYFIWCGVFGAMILANKFLVHHESCTLTDFRRVYGFGFDVGPYLIQCWFLRALFTLVLISPIINGAKLRIISVIVSAVMLVLQTFGCKLLNNGFWYGTLNLDGFFYLSVGVFLRYCPIQVTWRSVKVCVMGFACILLVAYAVLDYHHWHWARYCRFAMIPFALASVWWIIPERRLPPLLSRAAFPIFLIHFILMAPFRSVTVDWLPILRLLSLLSIGFGGSLLMSEALRRLMPKFAKIAFGGR